MTGPCATIQIKVFNIPELEYLNAWTFLTKAGTANQIDQCSVHITVSGHLAIGLPLLRLPAGMLGLGNLQSNKHGALIEISKKYNM